MIIDDSVIIQYLSGEKNDSISSHWVFQSIEEGKYLFEAPDNEKRDEIYDILRSIKKVLYEFTPLNEMLYATLYPDWKSIINEITVLLMVGCPNPYDAMVRKHDGKEYIIFDLMRFNDYKTQGYDIEVLINQLITHETSHLCLHKQFPNPNSENFIKQLKYITFDEGFAHLLAFKDNIEEFDFTTIIKEHYNNSLSKLKEAMKEEISDKQMTLLEQSNSGTYWGKFAAISGKLFLAKHLDSIKILYNDGIDNFISSME